jgi:hypothetical protein
MPESDAEQPGAADFVVGLVPVTNDGPVIAEAIARIVQSVSTSQAVLIHPPYAAKEAAPLVTNDHWRLVADPLLTRDPTALAQSLGDSFRVIFNTALKAGARTCAVIASDLSVVTGSWVELLLQPTAEQSFDLVAPCYARYPFEGMINRAIVYPLVRALYGKRIRNPLGPDFGISNALLERMVSGSRARMHPLASLAAEAVTGNMRICQAHLGPRILPRSDWPNLSSILAQVLGPLFLDVERYAPHWQRTRGSEAIAEFGEPTYAAGPDTAVDVKRLVESFGLGTRDLSEIWGMILPPSTLVELRRLARQDAGAFRMPDETWARIVYDFALGHRLRTISRDQMLRALTPIYLGWVASYALELDNASPEAVEQRLERLCTAYERTKSYLVARWRWPDRFNP